MCCLLEQDSENEFYEDDEIIEKPKKRKNIKEETALNKLKKQFDIVEVKEKEDFDLFVCKNKVKKPTAGVVEFEVWLSIKVKKNKVEFFAEDVLVYINKLFNFDKVKCKQIGLFDNEIENNINIENLNFWECINDYLIFDHDDYVNTIPKTDDEMIQIVKDCINLYLEDPEKEYDHFTFCDRYDYFLTKEPISDREMLSRLYTVLDINFGISTYVEDRYSIDGLGSIISITKKGSKKYRFDSSYCGNEYTINIYNGKTKVYDLYKKDFCLWLRSKFNIPKREPLADFEVIKKSFKSYANKFFDNEEQLKSFLSIAKNAEDFRKKVVSFLNKDSENKGHFGSAGGPLNDCYGFSYGYDLNHLYLQITQLNSYRETLNREIIKNDSRWDYDKTYIINIQGNEVFEKMYDYLSDKPIYIQATLF
jgi:hypothetical protein